MTKPDQEQIDEKIRSTLVLWSKVIRLRDGLVDDVKAAIPGAEEELQKLDVAIALVEMRRAR